MKKLVGFGKKRERGCEIEWEREWREEIGIDFQEALGPT